MPALLENRQRQSDRDAPDIVTYPSYTRIKRASTNDTVVLPLSMVDVDAAERRRVDRAQRRRGFADWVERRHEALAPRVRFAIPFTFDWNTGADLLP